MRFRGQVVRRQLAAGSKSAHEALVLKTAEGEYKLLRRGGNPFWDEALAPLEGKQIECEATLRDNQLIMSEWHIVGQN